MKRVSVTAMDNQKTKLDDVIARTKKSLAEFTELSRRDWKGGDAPLAQQNMRVVRELESALSTLDSARNELLSLRAIVVRRKK